MCGDRWKDKQMSSFMIYVYSHLYRLDSSERTSQLPRTGTEWNPAIET